MTDSRIIKADCRKAFIDGTVGEPIHLTFLDPPFNQNKDYAGHDDDMPKEEYWQFMGEVCKETLRLTAAGGAVYFMQREKNTEDVLRCLRETGWTLQNLVIWKKKTSAVPGIHRFGKHYQIIAFATKGPKPRVFHRLRISPPLPPNYKQERENGVFVTDVWDDIRELTSGYFAGDEAIREKSGGRAHKQQAPIALLLRIVLSSSRVGDTVFDPFAGTGTTLVVARQLDRNSIGIEIDPTNIELIKSRLTTLRAADDVHKFLDEYTYTDDLTTIWGNGKAPTMSGKTKQASMFE